MDAALDKMGVTIGQEKQYDLVELDICVPGATALLDSDF
jgi:hypothetical protein